VLCGWILILSCDFTTEEKQDFPVNAVHEKILRDGMRVVSLQATLQHRPYRSISHFLKKCKNTVRFLSEQNRGKKNGLVCKALIPRHQCIIKNYFFKLGHFRGQRRIYYFYVQPQTAYTNISNLLMNKSFDPYHPVKLFRIDAWMSKFFQAAVWLSPSLFTISIPLKHWGFACDDHHGRDVFKDARCLMGKTDKIWLKVLP